MGIVEEELAAFGLNGEECTIERNDNGRIDLHVGRFRMDFTADEFLEFADVIKKARNELVKNKGVN